MMSFLKWIAFIGLAVYIFVKFRPVVKGLIETHRTNAIAKKQRSEAIRDLAEEVKIENFAYKCPACGASMSIDPQHVSTFCSFCGAALPKADELISQSLEYAQKRQEHKAEMEKLLLKDKTSKRLSTLYFFLMAMLLIPFGILIIIASINILR